MMTMMTIYKKRCASIVNVTFCDAFSVNHNAHCRILSTILSHSLATNLLTLYYCYSYLNKYPHHLLNVVIKKNYHCCHYCYSYRSYMKKDCSYNCYSTHPTSSISPLSPHSSPHPLSLRLVSTLPSLYPSPHTISS